MMERYVRAVLRHRWAVLFTVAAATILIGSFITRGVIASAPQKLFFSGDPEFDTYRELSRKFGNDEIIVVGFTDDRLLETEGLQRIRRITAAVEDHPEIHGVESLATVVRIFGPRHGVLATPYLDSFLAAPEAREALVRELRSDPAGQGAILAPDGRSSFLLAPLLIDDERSAEAIPGIVSDVVAAFTDEGFDRDELHVAGLPATTAECVDLSYFTLKTITPAVIGISILLMLLLFRRVWPILVTLSVGVVSVVWAMGVAVAYDREINILMTFVPGVLLIVAFADVIHIVSSYLLSVRTGLDRNDAIVRSASEVGKACVMTSVTTCCGFGALMLVPTPVMRQLGFILGLGVAVALLLAVTLTPILLSFLRKPEPDSAAKFQAGTVDRVVSGCMRIATRQPVVVIVLFALVAATSVVGITRLRVEADFSKRLDEDNPVRRAERFLAEHFGGTNVLHVYVEGESNGAVTTPDALRATAALHDAVERLPEVDHAFSLAGALRGFYDRVRGSGTRAANWTGMRGALKPLRRMAKDRLDRWLAPNGRRTRLTLRLGITGFRETVAVGDRVEELAAPLRELGLGVRVTGGSYLFGSWVDEIVDGQRRGLGFALLSITILMVLGLRSVRVGLWSMLPNVFPLLVLGGYLGLTQNHTDSDVLLVAVVAIGLGVDDTIHFLMRFRIESRPGVPVEDAMAASYRFAGRAMAITTVVLALSFLPFMASDYYSTRMFGTLLPLTLVTALLTDLLLLPALVRIGLVRYRDDRSSAA